MTDIRFRSLAPALALLLVLLISPISALAQSSVIEGLAQEFETLEDPIQIDGGGADLLFPDLPANFTPSEATLQTMQEAVEGYYAYRRDQYLHRQSVFAWQHVSTQIIFAVVILIVAVGLYFSWIQFHASDKGRDIGTTDIEASEKGLRVSSPVLGVIILALSLGFFYLYLVHVYPISDVF